MHLRPLRIFSLVSLTVLVLAARATAQPAVIDAPLPPMEPASMVIGPIAAIGLAAIDGAMFIDQAEDHARDRSRDDAERQRDRETRVYEQARRQLDQSRYDRAILMFTEVAAMKGTRADAALYWKAWAQNKAGQRAEALTRLSALDAGLSEEPLSRRRRRRSKPRSAATAASRRSRRAETDDDLKLMAINALQNSDPTRRCRCSRSCSRAPRRRS